MCQYDVSMSKLVKVQVYLLEEQWRQIKALADKEGISWSAALRKVVDRGLEQLRLSD